MNNEKFDVTKYVKQYGIPPLEEWCKTCTYNKNKGISEKTNKCYCCIRITSRYTVHDPYNYERRLKC